MYVEHEAEPNVTIDDLHTTRTRIPIVHVKLHIGNEILRLSFLCTIPALCMEANSEYPHDGDARLF